MIVHTKTREEYDALINLLDLFGLTSLNGTKLHNENNYLKHGAETCLCFDNGKVTFSNKMFYKKWDVNILSYDEVLDYVLSCLSLNRFPRNNLNQEVIKSLYQIYNSG